MLTLKSIIATTQHMNAFGEGVGSVPRDHTGKARPMPEQPRYAAVSVEWLERASNGTLTEAEMRQGADDYLAEALMHSTPAAETGALREAIRNEVINTPETADFMAGVPLEAAHQRGRWSVDHDGGKTPFDWFWLIGYLAQKAASAQVAGDTEKAQHHTISTAAALANWHAQLSGLTTMRPGIGPGNGGEKPGSAYALIAALPPVPEQERT